MPCGPTTIFHCDEKLNYDWWFHVDLFKSPTYNLWTRISSKWFGGRWVIHNHARRNHLGGSNVQLYTFTFLLFLLRFLICFNFFHFHRQLVLDWTKSAQFLIDCDDSGLKCFRRAFRRPVDSSPRMCANSLGVFQNNKRISALSCQGEVGRLTRHYILKFES